MQCRLHNTPENNSYKSSLSFVAVVRQAIFFRPIVHANQYHLDVKQCNKWFVIKDDYAFPNTIDGEHNLMINFIV